MYINYGETHAMKLTFVKSGNFYIATAESISAVVSVLGTVGFPIHSDKMYFSKLEGQGYDCVVLPVT
jgi:hypothetical protein